ncbi:hypothetical protein GWK47_023761 [Chionoecetes opilio]|uniref:Uncharacterized protein n=1 Tax=Chionoecetes opilio TaxID=41210 RepID=A0A8J4XM36_CHIOP|nr:hypothetical protein GWK47_023761 [Chionoecetes opilio]
MIFIYTAGAWNFNDGHDGDNIAEKPSVGLWRGVNFDIQASWSQHNFIHLCLTSLCGVTMHTFALVSSVVAVMLLLPSSPVVLADPGVRVARQIPSAFPDGATIPVKIAGGRGASQPSVGALGSGSSSVSNRNNPPIVFGPRPRRPVARPPPTRRPFRPTRRPNPWFWRQF